MNRIRPKYLIILYAFPVFFTQAQNKTVQEIDARVLDVDEDQGSFTINRGKAEGVITDSLILVHPNRGDNEASIEWDLVLAEGKIIELREHESVVKVSRWIDTVKIGDRCDLYAKLPQNLDAYNIGVLAMYDIMFLDYDNQEPLFALSDFVFEFYRTLKSKKTNKINALREAQISLLESSDYSHPYFWGPFILIGDWR